MRLAGRRVLVARSLLLKKGVAVGLRDLIIVRMDFGEGQKAMAVAAIVHEGGLKRRLHTRDFGQIDVAAKLFLGCGFVIKFLDTVAAFDHHSGLFPMGGIDKHFR